MLCYCVHLACVLDGKCACTMHTIVSILDALPFQDATSHPTTCLERHWQALEMDDLQQAAGAVGRLQSETDELRAAEAAAQLRCARLHRV